MAVAANFLVAPFRPRVSSSPETTEERGAKMRNLGCSIAAKAFQKKEPDKTHRKPEIQRMYYPKWWFVKGISFQTRPFWVSMLNFREGGGG